MMKKKAKGGRPRLKAGEKMVARTVRLMPETWARVDRCAEQNGMSTAEQVRADFEEMYGYDHAS